VVAVPFEAVRGTFSRYIALVDTQSENTRLRARVGSLEEANLQLREALVASGRLQRIAEMRERYEIPMLPAELVGADVSPWFRSVLVDRGRDRGVRSGMPVISEQGLVGLVTATSVRSAKTTLVLDRQTAIDGVIQRSRARGIVRGEGSDELSFEFVARGSDVQVDDQVITSGLDGVYPKGLLIEAVRTGSGTSVYDALDIALIRQLGSTTGRKAIVMLSDGVDTYSAKASKKDVLGLIEEDDVIV
jgi:rod shape-determining protein MreC